MALKNWYPEMPPQLPMEDEGAYTDRLTGADKMGLVPYNHVRNRQCSIGWHEECSDPRGERCKCPCHDPDRAVSCPMCGAVVSPGRLVDGEETCGEACAEMDSVMSAWLQEQLEQLPHPAAIGRQEMEALDDADRG